MAPWVLVVNMATLCAIASLFQLQPGAAEASMARESSHISSVQGGASSWCDERVLQGQQRLEADGCPLSGSEGSALVTLNVNLHCFGAWQGQNTLSLTWDKGQSDIRWLYCEWVSRAGKMAWQLRALTCCSSRVWFPRPHVCDLKCAFNTRFR